MLEGGYSYRPECNIDIVASKAARGHDSHAGRPHEKYRNYENDQNDRSREKEPRATIDVIHRAEHRVI